MKKTCLILFALLAFGILTQAQETAPPTQPENPNVPVIAFESETIDYGTIERGADGNREFVFKNDGKEPLIISNCKGSCGCTVPTCPKEPILPGQTGKIKVKYDTNRMGSFTKTVTVRSNAKTPAKYLKIKGNVIAKKAEPATPPVQKKAEQTADQ